MIEKKGSQYRIRIQNPKLFKKNSFRNIDVGRKGGLQLIIGKKKFKRNIEIQAIRVSIDDFKKVGDILIPKTIRGKRELSYINKLIVLK